MRTLRVSTALVAALAVTLPAAVPQASAAADGPIKIAVITDMSGVYAALAGRGAVEATKMAVEDYGGSELGR